MLEGKGAGKTRNLRFASVNLDSLNNIEKLPFQRKLMADLNSGLDIICLQETKLAAKNEAAFLDDFKGVGVFSAVADPDSDGPRATTGVAILFPAHAVAMGLDIRMSSRRADSEGRWVAVDVYFSDARYTIVSVYAPAVHSERIPFLRGLRAALVAAEVQTTRLCVLGDFNAVLDGVLDRENGLPIRHGTGMEDFQQFVQQCGLVDVWRRSSPLAREYTGPSRGGSRENYMHRSSSAPPGNDRT